MILRYQNTALTPEQQQDRASVTEEEQQGSKHGGRYPLRADFRSYRQKEASGCPRVSDRHAASSSPQLLLLLLVQGDQRAMRSLRSSHLLQMPRTGSWMRKYRCQTPPSRAMQPQLCTPGKHLCKRAAGRQLTCLPVLSFAGLGTAAAAGGPGAGGECWKSRCHG